MSIQDKPVPVTTTMHATNIEYPNEGKEPSEATVSRSKLRMKNSDVLANLEEKLAHLPVRERTEVVKLIQEFTLLFTDTLGKTTAMMHDVDIGEASPCKQHLYQLNPLKLQHLQSERVHVTK